MWGGSGGAVVVELIEVRNEGSAHVYAVSILLLLLEALLNNPE